jgi:hypothetical protein
MTETTVTTPLATDGRIETAVQRMRRHQRLVLVLRLAVLVFLIGGWEFGVRLGVIDPFFFGQPIRHRHQADRLDRERHLHRPAVEADLGDDLRGRRRLPDRLRHGHPVRHRARA